MSPTHNVLGVGISPINMSQGLDRIDAWIAQRKAPAASSERGRATP